MTTVLDCTLRDGGYYNDWNFPLDVARKTIASLHSAGVDIIEIGLKSAADNQCSGLFKYCNEDYLDFLLEFSGARFSFMLNVKEFIVDGKLDHSGLEKIIRSRPDSVFSMCRLAAHYSDIELVGEFFQYFTEKGYEVGINLMGISLLSETKIQHAMLIVEQLGPTVFYVADSFGSMVPEDISRLIHLLKKHYSGDIGIHTHDNQGLAFANSLRAIDEGVEYIDATITGMGRGAGNLSTEQILLWLQNKGVSADQYHSGSILEIINDYFDPLKSEYKWGFNYVYMLSGLNNIHPVYCMDLCDGNKFSMSQISEILQNISTSNRASFDRGVLDASMNQYATSNSGNSNLLPNFNPAEHQTDHASCLIISTGPDVNLYQQAIGNLVNRQKLPIIECNDSSVADQFPERISVFMNRMRMLELVGKKTGLANTIVTGESHFEELPDATVMHYDYQIGEFDITDQKLTLPDFEAGQFAIGIALTLGYRKLYLAGFSGYQTVEQNRMMDDFFSTIVNRFDDLEITAITPSSYKNLPQKSIYVL